MAVIVLGLWFLLAAAALAASKLLASGRPFWSLAHFTSHLAAAVRRNLPLGQAIEAYAADLPKLAAPVKRAMLRTIAWEVDNGRPLSEVMGAYPGVFPESYRALVRAGERSGSLGDILCQLRAMAELDDNTARRATAELIYPGTLATMVACVSGLWAVKILPSFIMMFKEFELPTPPILESWVYVMNTTVSLFIPLLLLPILAAVFFIGTGVNAIDRLTPRFRLWAAHLRWRLPLWRRYERRRAAGNYALAAGRLLEAGVPEVEALGIAAAASGSARFEEIARRAAERVAEGQPLSRALEAEAPRGELPPELLWHIRLGEAAGDLPAALGRAAAGALERAEGALRGLVGLIFPAGVVAVGSVVWFLTYATIASLVATMEAFSAWTY